MKYAGRLLAVIDQGRKEGGAVAFFYALLYAEVDFLQVFGTVKNAVETMEGIVVQVLHPGVGNVVHVQFLAQVFNNAA